MRWLALAWLIAGAEPALAFEAVVLLPDGHPAVDARALLRAERPDPGPVERVVPGFALLDLGGVWRVTKHLEARAVFGNVLDREYLGSPDEQAVLGPGRHVLLTLSAVF